MPGLEPEFNFFFIERPLGRLILILIAALDRTTALKVKSIDFPRAKVSPCVCVV